MQGNGPVKSKKPKKPGVIVEVAPPKKKKPYGPVVEIAPGKKYKGRPIVEVAPYRGRKTWRGRHRGRSIDEAETAAQRGDRG